MKTSTFRAWALATVALTYGAILVGGFTRGSGAGLGCGDDWPLCQGRLLPDWSNQLMVIEWGHRYVAMLAGIAIFATAGAAWHAFRPQRPILWASSVAALLLPFQAYLGKEVVEQELHPALSALHMGVASALFGAVVALAIFAWQQHERRRVAPMPRPEPAAATDAGPAPAGRRVRAAGYLHILRPRMHTLLVLVALMAMLVAPGPGLRLIDALVVAVGGSFAIGGSSALNAYIERDSDARMDRTRTRLAPRGVVPPSHALVLGLVLILSGVVLMAAALNLLAATLTLGAAAYYLLVYTIWTKPTTHHNTVVGGIAGAIPPLVGWSAATGGIGWPAVAMAGLVFAWQPAHFFALALHYKDDYVRARLPMLPVVKGVAATKRAILHWTLWTMVAAAVLAEPLRVFGAFYLFASTAAGLLFLAAALSVRWTDAPRAPIRMFYASIAYLAVVFAAMAVDRLAF